MGEKSLGIRASDFRSCYAPVMNFSEALTEMKAGKRVRRPFWALRGYGTALEIVQVVSANDGRAIMPQLLVGHEDDTWWPFSGASRDLLADDWEVVDGGS
jgi:hypothetical protein